VGMAKPAELQARTAFLLHEPLFYTPSCCETRSESLVTFFYRPLIASRDVLFPAGPYSWSRRMEEERL
jgi:hypothetical protein